MAIAINESSTFFITGDDGDVHPGEADGLFAEDTRFLSLYEIRLDGEALIPLAADQIDHRTAEHFLSNPELDQVPASSLGVVRRRWIDHHLADLLEIRNYADHEIACDLELLLDADFADIFEVKLGAGGGRYEARWNGEITSTIEDDGSRIRISCRREQPGADLVRDLLVTLSAPIAVEPGRCATEIRLAPGESWRLSVDFQPITNHRGAAGSRRSSRRASPPAGADTRRAVLVANAPTLTTDSYVLRRAYERAVHDFAALRIRGESICRGNLVLAAGIPWFMALFGRDSLIAAYQALPFAPDLAAGTLRALASLQGTEVDEARAEQPGKILHEHRFGTLNGAQREIPRFPYYGSVDSTPLFLIVLAAYTRLTGDLTLARDLYPNALRALEWIEVYGDPDGDGYLEYPGTSGFLANQGWKDSGDSVRFRDGRLAEGPIALCEVQGYAYAARLGLADISQALGDEPLAARLRADAASLRDRFNHDFWLLDRGYYAEALDGRKAPVDSLTSNPGHLLWTGIVDDDRARAIADTLLSPPLFSGWGIRTMATTEGGYNPVSYHNGSVWPHDNSLIVAGLARYGLTAEATRVIDGILAALSHSPDHRLPELFAGYGSDEAHAPVPYPTACRPQAWAAGTVFLALSASLGIDIMGGASGVAERGSVADGRLVADGGSVDTATGLAGAAGAAGSAGAAGAAGATGRMASDGDALDRLLPRTPFLPNGIDRLTLAGLHLAGRRVDLDVTRDGAEGRISRRIDGGPYR